MSTAVDFALSVRQLRTVFRTLGQVHEAVRGVSLDLPRGEKLGVVGESGSGKSALALSILGLVEPPGYVESGEILLDGREISKCGEKKMRRIRGKEISLVYQDPMGALNPVRKIGDQIAEAVMLHGAITREQARTRAIELLEAMEVTHAAARLDDYPHEYSGGMRQRVVLAMALANEPAVLIADEPTTALDVTTQAQVLTLMNRLTSELGTAVILITHDLSIVGSFCEQIAVMYAGRFVETGATAEVLESPAHPYTAALLAAQPRPEILAGQLQVIDGFPPSLTDLPPGCAFEPRCQRGAGDQACQTVFPPRLRPAPGRSVECHYPLAEAEQFHD